MANFARIPGDLTVVNSKALFGLTKRQLIGVLLGMTVGLPVFFLIKKHSDITTASFGAFIVAGPALASGFIRINGLSFDEYIKILIKAKVTPSIRVYKTENAWEYFEKLKLREGKNGKKNRKESKAKKKK